MEKNKKSKREAFTLIELIVTIGIITIFTGFVVSSYNKFNFEQQLKNEEKKIINILELTRKKSISADLGNYSCPINTDFTGYQVIINNNLQINLCCGTNNNPCSTNYLINRYNLPSQILVNSTSDNFIFTNLEGKTNPSTQITITVKQTAIDKCANIYISPSGLINFDSNLTSC